MRSPGERPLPSPRKGCCLSCGGVVCDCAPWSDPSPGGITDAPPAEAALITVDAAPRGPSVTPAATESLARRSEGAIKLKDGVELIEPDTAPRPGGTSGSDRGTPRSDPSGPSRSREVKRGAASRPRGWLPLGSVGALVAPPKPDTFGGEELRLALASSNCKVSSSDDLVLLAASNL